MARTPELDAYLQPVSGGLTDLPELSCSLESAARLRNGNAALVLASNVEYGTECWVSLDGEPVAVGRYKAGEVHPSRVFVPS